MNDDLYVNGELRRDADLSRYTAKTFLLMCVGLLVTFGTAFFLGYTVTGYRMVLNAIYATNGFISLGLLVAELIVAMGMTALLHKISAPVAMGCFLLYSLLTGMTFSLLFLTYDLEVMIFAFGLTALYFGGMAIFGFVTHIDLSNFRSILLGGLLFLIAANVLMWFIPALAVSEQILCTVGVLVFLGYTAYDTQKLRELYFGFAGNEEMLEKASVFSALQLYLDFVNLFLYILRIMGSSKSKRK